MHLILLQVIESSRRNKNDEYMVAGLPCCVVLSWSHNKDCLEMAAAFEEQNLADGSKNPVPRTVYLWHNQWRMDNLGKYKIIQLQITHPVIA